MKRLFTFFLLMAAFASIQAQQYFINENFSGTWPPSGWTTTSQSGNWSAVNTANAGGTAPEARLNWSPAFNGETRLVTPAINLSEEDASFLVFSFKHMVDHYGSNYQIGLSVRTKGGPWTNLWAQTVVSSLPAQTRTIEITNPDLLNSDELQFSFFFIGNSYNINYWYIDDVALLSPTNFDLALTSITVPSYFAGEKAVTGIVTGNGLEAINSFDLSWQIDDGEVQTQNFSDLNIGYNQEFNFSTTELLNNVPGNYTLNVFVSNINGEEEDDVENNNHASKNIRVAHQEVQRLPLFESFTSSTCPPCFTFNNNFFNGFTQQNQNDIALIKYQMNWPGSGDPYYTAEGGTRRTYYGVSGVPDLFMEGKRVATSAAVVTSAFNAAKANPSFMAIEGYHAVNGNHILIEAEIMPYADFPNATIHVVVVEGTTTGNVGSNGETSFKHVMMKMLPNANGTTTNLNQLEPYSISYNFNMSGTKVEEMHDLKAIIFVQNNATKEVFQSATTQPGAAPEITLNIEDGQTNVALETEIIINFDQAVRHTDGSEITSESLAQIIHFSETDEAGATVAFAASINEEKNQISLVSEEPLLEEQTYFLQLQPVKGQNMFSSQPVIITFTTLSTVSVSEPALAGIIIYPNPAHTQLSARFPVEGYAELRILDLNGNVILKKSGTGQIFHMDVTSLASGLYFLEVTSSAGRSIQKVAIVR